MKRGSPLLEDIIDWLRQRYQFRADEQTQFQPGEPDYHGIASVLDELDDIINQLETEQWRQIR